MTTWDIEDETPRRRNVWEQTTRQRRASESEDRCRKSAKVDHTREEHWTRLQLQTSRRVERHIGRLPGRPNRGLRRGLRPTISRYYCRSVTNISTMASRALRSKKQLDCGGLSESEIQELSAAQPLFSDSSTEDSSGEEMNIVRDESSELQQVGEASVEKTTTTTTPTPGVSTVSAKPSGDQIARKHHPADLSVIWQTTQEDRAERKREKQESDRIRLEDENNRKQERREIGETLDKLQNDIAQISEKLSEQFLERMDKKCGNLYESITTLRQGTQQQIDGVNERIDNVTENMNEKIVQVIEIVNDKIDLLNECVDEKLAVHFSEAKKD
ncbi:hypothetical protein L798_01347 [Zootermopsis nevadensis]|uniref:Uncharacterized protein n=1 Tax=Zootermopsis nevadensis TaxID=136037 RepID=A0A067QTW9_ZOONE|nr:hypothetical protein L798_01347 [Zootermopsis nevadensis]